MKKNFIRILSLVLVLTLGLSIVGCNRGDNGKNTDPVYDDVKVDENVYNKDKIYVGNTAATTGASSYIGTPFNIGIRAAFAKYNAQGGFNGKEVELLHYDDGGKPEQSVTYMEKLIKEDDIFAVVGNFGAYAVNVNLSVIKENGVPMVYAAAGNNALFNANATTEADKCIFPVQPLNQTEGQMLVLRAFAPMYNSNNEYLGGLGGTKVGVISNSNEASQSMVAGIQAEAERSNLTGIVYQNVTTNDYSGAASYLVAENCDVIIVTVVGTDFISALSALAKVNYSKSVITTYNNSNASIFNNGSTMSDEGLAILSKMTVYAQAWLDITTTEYYFNEPDTGLYKAYAFKKMVAYDENGNALGVPGFTAEYWEIAKTIYDYVASLGDNTLNPWQLSYDSYALAGYIAGDLFCKALTEMQAQGKSLTRANLIEILESKNFEVAMAGLISYKNGAREGIQSFSLTVFYDTNTVTNDGVHAASSMAIHPLTSTEEYRAILANANK